ncbi:MAG: hypothetical protein IJZ33_04005 [Clostridia bacterium]|nr:hypothetical protein [Clostridia bacterium]
MKITVNILKSLILKLENELLFFEENTNFLNKRKIEIAKKYYVGLKINNFLEMLKESEKNIDEIKLEYQKFSKEEIPETNLTFADVFVLNEEETTPETIAYGLRICKDQKRYIPRVACEKIFQVNEAHRTIGEKTIVNCLQIFEEYFRSILKILISKKPEAYFYDKTIKYSLLIDKNIEELTNELINQEADALMYAVSETIEKANQTHKLKLEKHQDIWDAYIELDLRRNIIVHNEGRVNQRYLSSLPKNYPKPQDGSLLICDDIYVIKSIESLIKFAYLLYYLISDGEDELLFLESTAFEFLSSEKWDISLFAYDLLLAIPTLKNIDKTIYQINRLNAKKHINGLDSSKEEIEQFDVSGMENRYVIAKELLLEQHAKVNELLKIDYPESFDFDMIQTWPIFIEYRKSDEYREFINEHQTEYAKYELKEDEPPVC